jgi:hypothetical protein
MAAPKHSECKASRMLEKWLSASLNCRSENVRVLPVVIPELELGNIEGHVFPADLVERADDPALEDAPEALNRIRVHRADHVPASAVADGAVGIAGQRLIDIAFVGSEQANLIRHDFMHKSLRGFLGHAVENAGNHVPFAAERADDRNLSGRRMLAALAPLPSVFVLVLAADERFINLDNAAELRFRLNERGADFVAHAPSGPVGAEAHDPLNFEGADTLFARQHAMHNAEPLAKRLIRILKDGPGKVREAVAGIAARCADRALPMVAAFEAVDLGIVATRALDAFRPSPSDQIGPASLFVRERGLELANGHLVNGFRTAGHDFPSSVEGYCHA